jgi:hypothetical protein
MAASLPNYIPSKNPLSILDYNFDWSAWLAPNETIVSATVTVPPGITLYTPASVNAGAVVFWLSGGTSGQIYAITGLITTSAGRTDVRTFQLTVK